MIEIKNIVFVDKKNPIEFSSCFVNHLLPLRLKYISESFALLENSRKIGLITLEKDTGSYNRFKITKLILDEGFRALAHQLTNYVISRYRAMGACSFYAVVDEKQPDLIKIFKNELSFRECGFEYLYKVNNANSDYPMILRSLREENIKETCKFYNENINSFNRVLFSREFYQFRNNLKKYVFFNEDNTKILGYFEVATKNKKDYYINFVIDTTYSVYLLDAIKFLYAKIKSKQNDFNLYIKVKDCFSGFKELINILEENNSQFVSKSMILAKDYYKEIRSLNLFKNTGIIFNDPTTA